MDWITVLDNEYVTLRVSPEKGMVYHTFHKPIGGQSFRDALNTGIEAFKKYGATKWVSDDRLNTAMSQEDTEWSITDWNPRVMAAGWKTWAIVVPEDIMGRMNMAEFIDHYYQLGLRIMVFTNLEEAFKWIENI